MMELLKALYEQLGSSYPRGSLVVAAVIGATIFGGGWWLIGKQWEKDAKAGGGEGKTSELPLKVPPQLPADVRFEQKSTAAEPTLAATPRVTQAPQQSKSFENDVGEAAIAAQGNYSSMTMEDFFFQWYKGAKSSLQMDEFEREMLGKRVIWNGKIKEIKAEYSGKLRMLVSPIDGSYATAFLDFEEKDRSELLKLEVGQTIRFTGKIRSYVASPFLDECKVLKVIK